MAFHVACPITCKRICFCSLGFPRQLHAQKARDAFLDEVFRVEEFLRDNPIARFGESSTVQVVVPKVAPPQFSGDVEGADGEDLSLSAYNRRAAIQRKAVEDYARKFESRDLRDAPKDIPCDDQGLSGVNIMCRLCFHGENEGSVRAMKMLTCKSCDKKYHRNCIKVWAQYRDLFYWTSWTCPSCRICEVCRRTGDPNKFMFCKRCDNAYHCYCQQPPQKNVSNGPFLCPKHTKCHSCGSTVPGNGLSTRWFLGYTCCDACGRLFVKGNYCPVCLKVYRDSESTPMVCCDICQRWVHCVCDGISDEKYLQFQDDRNLQYKCATCRGECYRVKDLEDAVQEIWKRRDKNERDLITGLRANAGLPTQDDIFYISPYSDDEENAPSAGRTLKFSLKGLPDKTTKAAKVSVKKISCKKSKKKTNQQSNLKSGSHKIIQQNGLLSMRHSFENNAECVDHNQGISPVKLAGLSNKKFDDVSESIEERKSRFIKIKSNSKVAGSEVGMDGEKNVRQCNAVKGTKLVIHLGSRNRNMVDSPHSDGSSYRKEQDLTSNGNEDVSDGVGKNASGDRNHNRKSEAFVEPEQSIIEAKSSAGTNNGHLLSKSPERTMVFSFKRSARESDNDTERGIPDGVLPVDAMGDKMRDMDADAIPGPSITNNLGRDTKPLLKLKFKNPSIGALIDEDKSSIKGQRSKRKRPSSNRENSFDEILDASWVLKKLGKDAIGKRVEIQHPSEYSWHKGVVKDVTEDASTIDVDLDSGSCRRVELGKNSIRFVSRKSKRQAAT